MTAVTSMGFRDLATLDADRAVEAFRSSKTSGLHATDAAERLARIGPNEVAHHRRTVGEIVARQLRSPFIWLLFVAAAIALLTGEAVDASVIGLFMLINTGLGFVQEFRAEKAAQVLMQYWQHQTHVLRSGAMRRVASSELVPGDIIRLQAGDKIPADVRFLAVANASVDESVLTGESVTVAKMDAKMDASPRDYYEATNIGFAGTNMLTGEAMALVIATGRDSSLGEITRLTTETKTESAFEKEIAAFSGFILKLVAVTLAVMFALNLGLKGIGRFEELLLFSIALTVGVIPEALPVVSTLAMTRGALRMAKRHVIVKRLSAINDLGSIDVLCTDKTGTLTQNALHVADVRAADPEACVRLGLLGSSFIGEKEKQQNNAFDLALWKHASREARDAAKKAVKLAEDPFDPQRRRNTVLVEHGGGRQLIVRGAPEEVLELCADVPEPLELGRYLAAQGHAGNRVIVVASKPAPNAGTIDEKPGSFAFVGVISFYDPLKPDAKAAVRKAQELGVQIKVLTGDSKEVAGAVALKLGLVEDALAVLTGAELDAMDSTARHEALHAYHVFARVNPSQKFTIISLLKEKNIVGFLGEGFNDAPGLKLANVGLAVEGASDIAREAADVILLNKGLSVILDGIEEGRRTFANTIKYLKVTLASNFGNFYAVAVASLFIDFLPMLPLQILLVNLLTDFPMIAIAADTVDGADLKKPRRYDAHSIILHATILGVVSSLFDFMTFSIFLPRGEHVLQTMWFMVSNLTELAIIYSLRTQAIFFRGQRPPLSIVVLTMVAALTTVLLPFTSAGQAFFKFVRPEPRAVVVGLVIVITYFTASEIVKIWLHRTTAAKQKNGGALA